MTDNLSDNRYHPFCTHNKLILRQKRESNQPKLEWQHISFFFWYQTSALSMATVSVALWQQLSVDQPDDKSAMLVPSHVLSDVSCLCFIPAH